MSLKHRNQREAIFLSSLPFPSIAFKTFLASFPFVISRSMEKTEGAEKYSICKLK